MGAFLINWSGARAAVTARAAQRSTQDRCRTRADLLEVTPRGIRLGLRKAAIRSRIEHHCTEEVEYSVDGTIIEETKAENLRSEASGIEPTAGMPNMPILVYMLRTRGTLKICDRLEAGISARPAERSR
jgi:hypothetical protein